MTPLPCSLTRAGEPWIARRSGYVLLIIAALIGACYVLAPDPIQVHAEGGPLEIGQFIVWCLTLCGAVWSLVTPGARDDRIMAFWMCLLAAGALAREADLHEYLNEPTLGAYAVSFKISWWLDGGIPIWIKAGWITVALAGAAAFFIPPLLVKTPTVRLLKAGDAPSWFFIIAIAMYAVGYAMDDVLGRGRILTEEPGQAIEEISELFGSVFMCASVWLSVRYALSGRIEALGPAVAS